MGSKRCCAVFSSAVTEVLGGVKPVVQAPPVLFTGQIYPPFAGVESLLTYLSGLFGRHTVLRAVRKPICGRKMRPVGVFLVRFWLLACGRDRGEPRTESA